MRLGRKGAATPAPAARFPGVPAVADGREAAAAAAAAAGAVAAPPGIPAAADRAAVAAAAGLALTGLRAAVVASGAALAGQHAALAAAAGRRVPFVLHVTSSALPRHASSAHAGHDAYHAVADAGCFQLFARDVQAVADLALVAHRVAEAALTPGLVAQDAGLTSDALESVRLPEAELGRTYLGDPGEPVESPTPAQRLLFGERRRRIPEVFDLDYPTATGVVQNPDAFQQGVAAQRAFFLDHVADIADRALAEYAALTGRAYARVGQYLADDAEYLIVAQGSVVGLAEAVADHLRRSRRLRLGVLEMTMLRPFPADPLASLLAGRRAVLVLERADEPLAADPPLLRELRAVMGQALENGRAPRAAPPYPGLVACRADELPAFHAACFGLGGRPLASGDLVAAVEAMAEGRTPRRHAYLGMDFVRPGTRLPKLEIWQERLLESYPDLRSRALAPAPDVPVLPEGALAVRLHVAGGDEGRALSRALGRVAAGLCGLSVRVTPRGGAERRGGDRTFRIVLGTGPIRAGGDDRAAGALLLPGPVGRSIEAALPGLAPGGVIVAEGPGPDAGVRAELSAAVQQRLGALAAKMFVVDGARIAAETASGGDGRAPLRAAALLGAFFRVAPLPGSRPDPDRLAEALGRALQAGVPRLDDAALAQVAAAVRRGHGEVRPVEGAAGPGPASGPGAVPARPAALEPPRAEPGPGHPGRFWEQVGYLHATGQDGIADPFAALGVLPAVSSSIRDLTTRRDEVPELLPAQCTGCGQCWTQCPDTAILGLATSVEDVLGAAARLAGEQRTAARLPPLVKQLASESRRLLRDGPLASFSDVLGRAYATVAGRLDLAPDRRAALDAELAGVAAALEPLPLVRTAALFERPESRRKGSGALLSVTVNPETCKGCGLCVEACPEGALRMIPQTAAVVDRLRAGWRLWQRLPETDDAHVEAAAADERVGPLAGLLLKKAHALALAGGDLACPGCGEKTVVRLVLAAIHTRMQPRVRAHVRRLDDLIARLDQTARAILVSDADLGRLAGDGGTVGVPLEPGKKAHVDRLARLLETLRELRWRYVEGPGGRGRAACGAANATGCSAVWGSTYPLNPYPFPWVHHLDGDAPALALGLFEGHMRKMAAGFRAVRQAELELAGDVEAAAPLPLDWRDFTDDELRLCPPIVVVGGDGAMLDTGLQALSHVLAAGRPIRVVVLDTQGASITGGRATSASFLAGSDPGGPAPARTELGLLAIAHRGVFVLQSAQAAPAHLLAGVLRGLDSRYPAVFHLLSPCPTEHGTADGHALRAARLAIESRAFPLLCHDPAGGPGLAGRLQLDGNPAADQLWPVYRLAYVDESGASRSMELPVTVADWAASEGRFRSHFGPVPDGGEGLTPLHEYLALAPAEREGRVPFVYTVDGARRLDRLVVGEPIVRLAEDRREVWAILRDLAGLRPPEVLRLEAEAERRVQAVRAEYEAKLADLRARYPVLIARRLAQALLRPGGPPGLGDVLARAQAAPDGGADAPGQASESRAAGGAAVAVPAPAAVAAAPVVAAAPAEAAPAEDEAPVAVEPSIDTPLCTACNECTNLNRRMFAYNGAKQAYIKDPRAGTFQELVRAAEKCPVRIIHPGTPLDPAEKDLDKWIARAKPFN